MRVDVHVGLTFHLGPMTSNQYGRLDITLSDIDPGQDVEAQVSGGVAAAARAFQHAVREIDRQVDVMLGRKGGDTDLPRGKS